MLVPRALLLDPPIVIADDPTNDLDVISSASVTDVLFERVEQGGYCGRTDHYTLVVLFSSLTYNKQVIL
ncbi:MAG: hypothetical protein RR380_04495 [Gordonibacter sp.]